MTAVAVPPAPRTSRRWSSADDQLLRRLYAERLPVKQIAARLGRAPDAIVARRQSLHIEPRQPRTWSAQEDALLRAGIAAGLPVAVIAPRLGRSPDQVRARRRMLVGARPAGRPYLPDEDEAIRTCLTAGGELKVLACRLGRSPDALRLRAQQLGLHHPAPRRRWADWEDAIVRDGYTRGLPCSEIARLLSQRSAASVAARARRLGSLGSYARRWDRSEDQLLMALIARGDTLEIAAEQLGRTPEGIRRHASRLGITPPPPTPAPRQGRRWTSEEDELLRLHHALNPARLGQLLGRSDGAVCRRLRSLGLRARAQRSPHHPPGRSNGRPRRPAAPTAAGVQAGPRITSALSRNGRGIAG